jgi:crotonobetainyl-CoA:carnitine CoA-transferase CaiB-like acyl-CoA transferase
VKPLDSYRIVDFSQLIAGPSATSMMADLGATVIKVETPSGDPARRLRRAETPVEHSSPTYRVYNAGKRSIALDLRTPEGQQIAHALLRTADVLVESFRPGVMDNLGLGQRDVHEINPRLVYASLAGFGFGPSARGRRGVDLVIQAESGLMSVTGFPDGPPTKVGFTIVDAVAGHVLTEAVLAALLHRERSGGPARSVRVSLLDVALHLQAGPLSEYLETGHVPRRSGNAAPTTAPADLLSVKDGYIVVSAYLDAHWRSLCGVLGRDDLVSDPRFATVEDRLAHRAELCATLEEALLQDTAETWLAKMTAERLVAGAVKDYAQVAASVEARESPVLAGAGQPLVGSPFSLSGMDRQEVGPAPDLGADTAEILRELGYPQQRIDELTAAAVVYQQDH